MPKIVDIEQKKLEIIDRAINVFSEKGYYNTNLIDIAKACSMGRTTLYQYFNNKDEIYLYILELGMSYFLLKLNKLKQDVSLSNIDRLKKITNYLLVNIDGQRVSRGFVDFWLMVRHNNSDVENRLFELYEILENSIKELLDLAVESKEIKIIDTSSMASLFIGALDSVTFQEIIKDEINVEKLHNSMIILINGLVSLNMEEEL